MSFQFKLPPSALGSSSGLRQTKLRSIPEGNPPEKPNFLAEEMARTRQLKLEKEEAKRKREEEEKKKKEEEAMKQKEEDFDNFMWSSSDLFSPIEDVEQSVLHLFAFSLSDETKAWYESELDKERKRVSKENLELFTSAIGKKDAAEELEEKILQNQQKFLRDLFFLCGREINPDDSEDPLNKLYIKTFVDCLNDQETCQLTDEETTNLQKMRTILQKKEDSVTKIEKITKKYKKNGGSRTKRRKQRRSKRHSSRRVR